MKWDPNRPKWTPNANLSKKNARLGPRVLAPWSRAHGQPANNSIWGDNYSRRFKLPSLHYFLESCPESCSCCSKGPSWPSSHKPRLGPTVEPGLVGRGPQPGPGCDLDMLSQDGLQGSKQASNGFQGVPDGPKGPVFRIQARALAKWLEDASLNPIK